MVLKTLEIRRLRLAGIPIPVQVMIDANKQGLGDAAFLEERCNLLPIGIKKLLGVGDIKSMRITTEA
jgi:hypothetical protein